MDAPRAVLLLFLLLFLIVTPDTQRSTPHQQLEVRNGLENERYAVDILNASSYGDFDPAHNLWLNVTGLRQEDSYAWDLLPDVQAKAWEQVGRVVDQWKILGENNPSVGKSGSRYLSVESIDGGNGSGTNISIDSSDTLVPFYQNISGIVNGKWVRSPIGKGRQHANLNLTQLSPRTAYTTREYNRNISGYEGDLRIKFDEKKSQKLVLRQNTVREIKAEMTIQDETSTGDGWEMTLHGVHYPESGSVLLSSSSDKFAGIFALPYFARSEPAFVLAQQLLNLTLMSAILRQEETFSYISPSFPWSSSPDNPSEIMFPTPHCEYIVYMQQHLPKSGGRTLPDIYQYSAWLAGLEEELRHPTGASVNNIPPIVMSAVIFSPDCGFVLESKGPPAFPSQAGDHLQGPKLEAYLLSAKRIIILFSIIIAGQIFLLMRQMKETSTPSTRSRISFYTIAIMAMGDGFVSIGFWTISMTIDATFLIMISTAFLAFLCVSFFGMKFLMDIWSVQAPERREADRRNAVVNPPPNPRPNTGTRTTPTVIITPAGADTLPLPATARRPSDAPPIILPPDQDLAAAEADDATAPATPVPGQTTLGSARREMGALYSRFYFLLMGILFLSLHATNWPNTLRTIYANLLASAYLSLWVPQIYRNIIRNCRKALRWEFVIGQSILRLIPLMYFYTVTDNVLFVEPDRHAAYALIGWVWIQFWILVSQELLGPRFFVPNGWAPPAYDYHPILRNDDEEAGSTMPIGFTQATADENSPGGAEGSKSVSRHVFDCAICMQNIDVPIASSFGSDSEASTSLAAGLFSRRAYMVTPCRHIFHSPCLEGWMRYRLQCPICRENLPPL